MPDVQRGDQFGAALHADLAEHGLEVVLDRERRDAERRSDLLGAAPLGGERGDLPFARGKPGLRLGLFDITVQAGRTDWADPAQVTELGERWHGLLTLLRAHGDHEDQHILRLLDARDPLAPRMPVAGTRKEPRHAPAAHPPQPDRRHYGPPQFDTERSYVSAEVPATAA